MVNNKIPQEIEEKILKEEVFKRLRETIRIDIARIPFEEFCNELIEIGKREGQKQKVDEGRTQTLEKVKKMIEDVGLEDVIDFLDGLKDFTINEEHPFGTCDYMAIDDMIFRINKLLSQLEDDEVRK